MWIAEDIWGFYIYVPFLGRNVNAFAPIVLFRLKVQESVGGIDQVRSYRTTRGDTRKTRVIIIQEVERRYLRQKVLDVLPYHF